MVKLDAMTPESNPRGPCKKRRLQLAKWLPVVVGPATAFLCLYLIKVAGLGDYLRIAVEYFGEWLSLGLMFGMVALFILGPLLIGYKVHRGLQALAPNSGLLIRTATIAVGSIVVLLTAFAFMDAIPRAFQAWMEHLD